MNIIINSNNDAIRLKALLESIKYYWNNNPLIYINYSFTNDEFKKGYNRLEKQIIELELSIKFIKDFHVDLPDNRDYTLYLNSDNIFTRNISKQYISYLNNPTVLVYSLLLGKNINGCPKEFVYNYRNHKDCFGDLSLDGYIFYKNNYLEFVRNNLPSNQNNIVIEKLSSLIKIKTLNQSLEELNQEYLKGKKIDISPFMFINNNSIIVEDNYSLRWE